MEETFDFEDLIRRVEADDQGLDDDDHKEEDRCQECGGELIERDGLYFCNICQTQAQIVKKEVECNLDEDGGQFIKTQRLAKEKRDPELLVDRGVAWTTNDAYNLILERQVETLEYHKMVSRRYYQQVQELWFSYFKKFLMNPKKTRDRDSKDIPSERSTSKSKTTKPRAYRVGDYELRKERVDIQNIEDSQCVFEPITELVIDEEDSQFVSKPITNIVIDEEDSQCVFEPITELVIDEEDLQKIDKEDSSKTVDMMSLGKTLGFLEAIARLRCCSIFASDLARWSDQGSLPYHDCVSYFPADWKLNYKDRMTFSQRGSPKPYNISRSASLILNSLCDPFELPLPDSKLILRRILSDMNLPWEMVHLVLETITFHDLRSYLSVKLGSKKKIDRSIPQFDRWAAAMIIVTLKRYFVLDGIYENSISSLANGYNKEKSKNIFVFKEWFEQSLSRLMLIQQYDVGNYNQDFEKMESSTLYRFFTGEAIKWFHTATIKKPDSHRSRNDVNLQRDLKHFLMSAIPVPVDKSTDSKWDKPNPSVRPFTDAFNRVRGIGKKVFPHFVLDRDFRETTMSYYVCVEKNADYRRKRDSLQWSVDKARKGQEDWSMSFRHLLDISGFLCYCDPREILREIQYVELTLSQKQ